MKWRRLIPIAFVTSLAIAVAAIVAPMVVREITGGRTVRFGRQHAARMDGSELIVWRYGRRWFVVDFGSIAFCFGIPPIGYFVLYIKDELFALPSRRRERQQRGFEVLPPKEVRTGSDGDKTQP